MANANIDAQWDYTAHAAYYKYRPNYAPVAMDRLCKHVGARAGDADYEVADIGAGTGNLTMLLKDRVGSIIAVEPNDAMRQIGIDATKNFRNVKWAVGTGENMGLEGDSVDWVTFGSSFNTTKRDESLRESHRVLKHGGYFTCMWNNRDLNEPAQKKVEGIVATFVPNYSHGTRREQQADTIIGSRLFNHLYYLEEEQMVDITLENYINAWKSVKNPYWDLQTAQGRELFQKITDAIKKEFGSTHTFRLKYITKAWTAKRED